MLSVEILPEPQVKEPANEALLKVAVCNGLSSGAFLSEVLVPNRVDHLVEMVPSRDEADVVVFGPYGFDVPPPGPYVTVAYICENLRYDGPACDFIFRVPTAAPKGILSERIQWHGFDPQDLVKPRDIDVDAIAESKDKFCCFLYSNRVPYRERIFRELSKYKRVDAPGVSMNNHPSIDGDALPGETKWETKRRFLARYKFTLALENFVFSGYQTEKLYDAMLAFSVPVYVGDPRVTEIFDEGSFVNLPTGETAYWISRLEDFAQLRWVEIVGPDRRALPVRVRRKLRKLTQDIRHQALATRIVGSLVERVIALDRDPEAYGRLLSRPWLKANAVPEASYSTRSWMRIFELARGRRRPA